jgi:DNA-binding NtrC family response regulator
VEVEEPPPHEVIGPVHLGGVAPTLARRRLERRCEPADLPPHEAGRLASWFVGYAGDVTDTKTRDFEDVEPSREGAAASTHVLVLAWSAAAPARVGEVLALGAVDDIRVFGRGAASTEERPTRTLLRRSQPGLGAAPPGEPLDDPFLSRQQLELADHVDGVRVVNVGKRPMTVGGQAVTKAVVRPGELLEIKSRLLFVCVRRPKTIADLLNVSKSGDFGEPDDFGYVGESVAAWSLRDRVAFIAKRTGHVLLLGASGAGKELVAQGVHARSDRAGKRLVARNAATFPSGLIDAELFGNVANYPNAGMPERPGLIGEAEGSTLFLDEIGELPESLQAHLLRVLDEGGEYQRLGDARRRRADLRLIAATNRSVEHLKHDLAARLRLRLELPGLNDRIEDIPLIARHLLRRAASKDREIGERFLEGWNGKTGEPRLSVGLVSALLLHRYATHVRELETFLWSSLTSSPGNVAELTEEARRALSGPRSAPSAPSAAPPTKASELTEEQVRGCMAKHAGVKERVWRELGLASRFALRRLLTKYGIEDDGHADE